MHFSSKLLSVLAVGGLVFACGGQVNNSTDCPAGQRFFNGECLLECAASAQCSGGAVCVALDTQGGVCMAQLGVKCSYLGSDTRCVGIDSYYYYGFRGFSEYVPLPSDPPNASSVGLTSYTDPYFASYGMGYDPYGTQGCQGDATYAIVAPSTDPACEAEHDVVRCRRVGDACRLVQGTTKERVAP